MNKLEANDIINMEYLSNYQNKHLTLHYKNDKSINQSNICYLYSKINNLTIMIDNQNILDYAYKNYMNLIFDLLYYLPKNIDNIFYNSFLKNRTDMIELIIKYFRDKITISKLEEIKNDFKSLEIIKYINCNFDDIEIENNKYLVYPEKYKRLTTKLDNSIINNFLIDPEQIMEIKKDYSTDKDFIMFLLNTNKHDNLLLIDQKLVLKTIKSNIHKLINESTITYINNNFKNTNTLFYMYITMFLRNICIPKKHLDTIENILTQNDFIKFVGDIIVFDNMINKVIDNVIRLYKKNKLNENTLTKIIDIILINEYNSQAINILCKINHIDMLYKIYESNNLTLEIIFHNAIITGCYEILYKIIKTNPRENQAPYVMLKKEIINHCNEKLTVQNIVSILKEINDLNFSLNVLVNLSIYFDINQLMDIINLLKDNTIPIKLLSYSIKDNCFELSKNLIEKYHIDTSIDPNNFTTVVKKNNFEMLDLLFRNVTNDIDNIFTVIFKAACNNNNLVIINYLLSTCNLAYEIIINNKLLHYMCENSYISVMNRIKSNYPKYKFSYQIENDYVTSYMINNIKYSNVVNIKENQECPICYESADIISSCKHLCCSCCIKKINSNKRSVCSMCRTEDITYKKVKIEN